MTHPPQPVVYDCNILLGAILSTKGADYACLQLVETGAVTLILSQYVLTELRRTPQHPNLQRFKFLTTERVEAFINNLLLKACWIETVPMHFQYRRDPDDAHYVNLALAANAIYVVSRDADLRDLMDPQKPEAAEFQQRFPQLRIMKPPDFLDEMRRITASEA